MSPLGKLDFRHNFRPYKLNSAQSADLAVKRILFRPKRLQASKDLLKRLVIETGSNLANMNQAVFLVIQAEHQRPEIFAAALRIGVASDDALLTLGDFDFQPIPRALLFVNASALLAENALQSALFPPFKKIKPFLALMILILN